MSNTPRLRTIARGRHAAVVVALILVPAWTPSVRSADPPTPPPSDASVNLFPAIGRGALANSSGVPGRLLARGALPPFGGAHDAMVCDATMGIPRPRAQDLTCEAPPAVALPWGRVPPAAGVEPSLPIDRGGLTVSSGPPGWIVERDRNAPWPTQQHAMAYDAARGRVLYSGQPEYRRRIQRWDVPLAWEWNGPAWTPVRGSPFTPAEFPAMAYDTARERVVSVDSNLRRDGDFDHYFDGERTSEWDGRAWIDKGAAPFGARQQTALAYDAARGRVVLFGGYSYCCGAAWGDYTTLSDTWEWDGSTWIERTPSTSPWPRFGHAMAYDSARQRVVMFGGYDSWAGVMGDTWEWDGTTWAWIGAPTTPEARYAPVLAYDSARQRTVLFGGASWDGVLADTWEWDGTTWVEAPTLASPPARRSAAMAYDSGRQRTVLRGGFDGVSYDYLDDTWEWDGTAWAEVRVAAGPAPRESITAMAYDRDRGLVVAVVERDYLSETHPLLETWEWDGEVWVDRSTGTGPVVWGMEYMAYDEVRHRVVLFDGYKYTWEWDGGSWEQRASFFSVYFRAVVYDSARGRVVGVGAESEGEGGNLQTWEWDGTSWSLLLSPVGPPNRNYFALAYDRGRERLVLFGGMLYRYNTSDLWFNDTWEWDGGSWTQRTPAVSPSAGAHGRMVYDEARGRIVLRWMDRQSWEGDPDHRTWDWDGNDWTETTTDATPGFAGQMTYDSTRQRTLLVTNGEADIWSYGLIDPCATATSVAAFSPGAGTDSADAAGALGPRDGQAASLGTAGAVVLRLVPPVADQLGTDLIVYENGARAGDVDERYWVEVSADNVSYAVGMDCSGGECLVDLARSGLAEASFVRITDVAPAEAGTTAPRLGADIDALAAVHCGEICNGLDDSRDGATPADETDGDGDGYVGCQPWVGAAPGIVGGGDCDAVNAAIHPGALEVCNGIDDDCDGIIDNGGNVLCDDGNACTDDSCGGVTGCVHTDNTAACSDGNACTLGDSCGGGVCVSGTLLVCLAFDQCHAIGTCDPATGACSNPIRPDGTTCNDNDLCTTGEACQDGSCTPAFSGLDEPNPRTNGYYKRLCHGPHSGDELTDADAACVAQVTATFAGISTVAQICDEIEPSHPNNDKCDQTEDDLMVLALNICRARVCTAQGIDSQCGGNTSVGQSLAESDAILDSPSRNFNTCSHAKCLDEEINTGGALEMNSLTLNLEGSDVRLDWSPPYLDDGTGLPRRYNIWRRLQGSLSSFTRLGESTVPTFFDTSSGSDAFEYEITAVMN